MNQESRHEAGTQPSGRSDDSSVRAVHATRLARRTVEKCATFFAPHLRPGMRLLDCGCGPGTITLGLATIVAPGEVVGIDNDPERLEAARAAAREEGVANVTCQEASILELPFPDGSFDAAFSHALMEHLPVRSTPCGRYGACWRRVVWSACAAPTTRTTSMPRRIQCWRSSTEHTLTPAVDAGTACM